MHVVEIFLPLSDNDGRPFGAELFGEVRRELVDRFGGLTAFTQSPAEGLWKDEGETSRDDIVVFEVMADEIGRGWWGDYRRKLEDRFQQEEIVVRARKIELL